MPFSDMACANCRIGRHRIAHVSSEPFQTYGRIVRLHRHRCVCPLCSCPVQHVIVDVVNDGEQTYLLRVVSADDNINAATVPIELMNSTAFADPTLSMYMRVLKGLRELPDPPPTTP